MPRDSVPAGATRRGRSRRAVMRRLLLACAVVAAGCSGASEPAGRGRALVVGLDGATEKVIRPLIADGRLPHLAAIERDGVRGAMRPEPRPLSPRIWTTVATGRKPADHGIRSWVKVGEDGVQRLYSNRDRRVPALWNIASARGRSVGVVAWLMTQPPDVVRGVMISDHALPGVFERRRQIPRLAAAAAPGRPGRPAEPGEALAPEMATVWAYPPEWVERARRLRDAAEPLTAVPDPFDGRVALKEIGDFLQGIYRNDELAARMALEVEGATHPELLMVYLPGIDRVSHLIWQGIETPPPGKSQLPVLPEDVRAEQRRALLAYYEFADALLGRLMERFGPDDLVLVLSDHGFEAGVRKGDMMGVHHGPEARNGVLYARGRGIPAGVAAQRLRDIDVMPTVAAWMGLPLSAELPGKPAAFLGEIAVERVESYADVPVERVDTPASELEPEILEKLRILGYIE